MIYALILSVLQLYTQQMIFHTDLIYSCAQFVVKNDLKSSDNGGYKYDLMMILDSGLLFWVTLYIVYRLHYTVNDSYESSNTIGVPE